MSDDFYSVLGINRNASASEIQKAYRDAARKYHPDMNPDDKTAKEKFQKVQQAYDVLNDPEKRELYDRYGSSFEQMGPGGPGAGPQWRTQPGGGGAQGFEDFDFGQVFGDRYSPESTAGFEDIFRQFTGGGAAGPRARRRGQKRKGADLTHTVTIPFRSSIVGGEIALNVQRPDGHAETITAKTPPGIEDGKQIRLRGQGEQVPGGTPGDLLITVHVTPHPVFTRHGHNLEVKLPVTLSEAAAGAKIDLPTPHGTIALKIPAGTSSGKRLRVKGHGVRPKSGEPGDLFAVVEIVLPSNLSADDQAWLAQLAERYPQTPRADLVW
jgi:DnaJ-class molecular chaperone